MLEALNLVNQYRKEACTKGYPDPWQESRKLTPSDYHPVKWSGDLEWIAQLRAAEGTVVQDHLRPNGAYVFSDERNGVTPSVETLAWNFGSLLGGIKQWYEEKEDWVEQNPNKETGHYTAMIDPEMNYIGIGCFTSTSGDWSCVAGAFVRS